RRAASGIFGSSPSSFKVEPFRRSGAGIACAAVFPLRGFAEVAADAQLPGFPGLHEASPFVIAPPRAVFLRRIANLPDEIGVQAGILLLPEQKTIRRQSVAPG